MSLKSDTFKDKPESISGFLILVGLLSGFGYLLFDFILPLLTPVAGSTISYATMITIFASVAIMVLNPSSRRKFSMIQESLFSGVSKSIIRKNPVKALDDHLKKLKSDLLKMAKQIGDLRGQLRRLEKLIRQNEAGIQENMEAASAAKERSKEAVMHLKARKAARLHESNIKLKALHERISKLNEILSGLYEQAEVLIEDIKDQVEVKKAERTAILASHAAMESARQVVKGDKRKLEIFDQAMASIADDLGNKVGEIERFLDISGNFMDTIDLQNDLFAEEGLKLLEELEKKSRGLLLASPEKDALDLEQNQAALDLEEREKEKIKKKENPYSDLFDS